MPQAQLLHHMMLSSHTQCDFRLQQTIITNIAAAPPQRPPRTRQGGAAPYDRAVDQQSVKHFKPNHSVHRQSPRPCKPFMSLQKPVLSASFSLFPSLPLSSQFTHTFHFWLLFMATLLFTLSVLVMRVLPHSSVCQQQICASCQGNALPNIREACFRWWR